MTSAVRNSHPQACACPCSRCGPQVSGLSGGQRKRVALAAALLGKPDLLVGGALFTACAPLLCEAHQECTL